MGLPGNREILDPPLDLPQDMTGWFPGRVRWKSGRPFLEWVYLGNHLFTDPFFDSTVSKHIHRPINAFLGFTTPLQYLDQLQVPDPVRLSGFIFHVSRCGSTLVSQMLAAAKGCRVLSEPTPFDDLLRTDLRDPSISPAEKLRWLKCLAGIFGQKRGPDDRHLFIKFHSWHIMALPYIHKIFPHVPILFLYRDPVEVLVSHQREAGMQMVQGLIQAEWFGASEADIRLMSPEAYRVWVLETFFRAAHRHTRAVKFTFMDYASLPSALWEPETAPFRTGFSSGDIRKMKTATRVHSKELARPFTQDSQEKQALATPELRGMVAGPLWELYEKFRSMYH